MKRCGKESGRTRIDALFAPAVVANVCTRTNAKAEGRSLGQTHTHTLQMAKCCPCCKTMEKPSNYANSNASANQKAGFPSRRKTIPRKPASSFGPIYLTAILALARHGLSSELKRLHATTGWQVWFHGAVAIKLKHLTSAGEGWMASTKRERTPKP